MFKYSVKNLTAGIYGLNVYNENHTLDKEQKVEVEMDSMTANNLIVTHKNKLSIAKIESEVSEVSEVVEGETQDQKAEVTPELPETNEVEVKDDKKAKGKK